MSLISDLNTAVEKVVQEFKNSPTVVADNKLIEENEKLLVENTELKTAIQTTINHLTTLSNVNVSNMEEPVVTSLPSPEPPVPS